MADWKISQLIKRTTPTLRSPFIVFRPTSLFTRPLVCLLCCICSAFTVFSSGRGVSAGAVAFFMFASFHTVARGKRSEVVCLIGSFWVRCCDRASVISSRSEQDVRSPHTFHSGGWKIDNGKLAWCWCFRKWDLFWKMCPVTAAARCSESLWPCHSVSRSSGNFIESLGFYYCSSPFSERSLCFNMRDDFNIFLSECLRPRIRQVQIKVIL